MSAVSESSSPVCNHCHKRDVEELNGEIVCTSCGTAISDCSLRPPDFFDASGSKFLSHHNRTFPANSATSNRNHALPKTSKDRISFGKKECLKVIDSLSVQCNMNEDMVAHTKSLLDDALAKIKRKGSPFRVLLATSCVYHVLKEHKMPFLLKDFCKSNGHKQQSFLSVYHEMCRILNLKSKNYSIEDQVQLILFNLPHATLAERQKKQEVIRKTIEVFSLAEKCWLTSGRSVMPVILASAYFAWNLVNLPKPVRTFDYFYHLFNFDLTKSVAEDRVREMYKTFLKLASYIPHVDKSVLSRRHIIYFLKDILEYSDYLLSCHVTSANSVEDDDEVTNTCDFRCLKPTIRKEDNSAVEVDCSVSDEDLIPDSDWGKYIRSEEEIEKLKDHINECE